jgi:hypothetical protein|tara:strand:+ start:23231 stop:25039 length:1809 start_codon:yes stop_codon:yes gene_type:complete
MAKRINYNARNFLEVRSELINFVKQYYPELFSDFNDASVGQMLLELNAAVADMLSFNTDRAFQETQIDYAQEKSSLLGIGRTLGLNIPGVRPSICLVDFRVTVPPKGDTFDNSYCPILKYGSQVQGGGQTFEVNDDIDFSSPLSVGGIPNRKVRPNVDTNGVIVSYYITKRELVVNGTTKILKRNIRPEDLKPFLQIVLPDTNVIGVEQIKMVDGIDAAQPTLSEFISFENRFYEVESLAENQIFLDDYSRNTDNSSITPGKWVNTDKKFIKEYTDKGFCKVTFGSGTSDASPINNYLDNGFTQQVQTLVNNKSLGELPKANSTIYMRYRVGGGQQSNIGPNVLNTTGIVELTNLGSNANTVELVNSTLVANNPVAAIGGADTPTIEELRYLIKYNFATQNRAVTVRDYLSLLSKMGSKFGVPFRVGVSESQNKIDIATLGLSPSKKLSNEATLTLQENISRYLANYRMINDYVTISGGRILNIGFEIYAYLDDNFNRSLVSGEMINAVRNYMNINNQEMGQNIYLADLSRTINSIDGVLNVTEMKVFNRVGGEYSIDEVPQPYIVQETREINTQNNLTLFGDFNTMFEIKYPENDIKVIAK